MQTKPPICPIHNTEMVWKTGISKPKQRPDGSWDAGGRQYAFYSCSGRTPNGSYCTYKPPADRPRQFEASYEPEPSYEPPQPPRTLPTHQNDRPVIEHSSATLFAILAEIKALNSRIGQILDILDRSEEKRVNRNLGIVNTDNDEIPII